MRIGLIKTKTIIHALAISFFLFNGHKIAGRFGSAPKANIGEWAKEFPGIIITHQPFESLGSAMASIAFYLITSGICFYLGVRILMTAKNRKYIPWFFAFVFAWGLHEVHHMFSAYPNGKIFAFWFSLSALIVLPTMMTWNVLVVLLRKVDPVRTSMIAYPGQSIKDKGEILWRSVSHNRWRELQNLRVQEVIRHYSAASPSPDLKNRIFYRLE